MDLDPVARHILTLTADGIVVLNAQGIIQYVNTTARALFDTTTPDISGNPLEALIPAQIARERADVDRLVAAGDSSLRARGERRGMLRAPLLHVVRQRAAVGVQADAGERAWADFCQSLFGLNSFLYLE